MSESIYLAKLGKFLEETFGREFNLRKIILTTTSLAFSPIRLYRVIVNFFGHDKETKETQQIDNNVTEKKAKIDNSTELYKEIEKALYDDDRARCAEVLGAYKVTAEAIKRILKQQSVDGSDQYTLRSKPMNEDSRKLFINSLFAAAKDDEAAKTLAANAIFSHFFEGNRFHYTMDEEKKKILKILSEQGSLDKIKRNHLLLLYKDRFEVLQYMIEDLSILEGFEITDQIQKELHNNSLLKIEDTKYLIDKGITLPETIPSSVYTKVCDGDIEFIKLIGDKFDSIDRYAKIGCLRNTCKRGDLEVAKYLIEERKLVVESKDVSKILEIIPEENKAELGDLLTKYMDKLKKLEEAAIAEEEARQAELEAAELEKQSKNPLEEAFINCISSEVDKIIQEEKKEEQDTNIGK